jgi:hypothetical protein
VVGKGSLVWVQVLYVCVYSILRIKHLKRVLWAQVLKLGPQGHLSQSCPDGLSFSRENLPSPLSVGLSAHVPLGWFIVTHSLNSLKPGLLG